MNYWETGSDIDLSNIEAAISVEFASPGELAEACRKATNKLEETIWEQSLLQEKLRFICNM